VSDANLLTFTGEKPTQKALPFEVLKKAAWDSKHLYVFVVNFALGHLTLGMEPRIKSP